MVKLLRPHYLSISLIIIYLFLRASSLFTIAFFNDEAEYLFWAKTMIEDPSQYLISLNMGVKPMFVWLQIPFLLLGTITEIHEARLVSLVSGLFTMLAIYCLTQEFFNNKKISYLAVVIFILFPFAQMYNSVSVFESTVSAFLLFGLLLSVKLVKYPSFVITIGLGIVMGLGMLTKKHAYFNVYFLPMAFLFSPFSVVNYKRLFRIVLLAIAAIGIAILMQQVLKLSPNYERISWYEGGTLYPKKVWLLMPLSQKIIVFMNNSDMWLKIVTYLTFPYLFLITFSITLYKKYWRAIGILLSYFIFPALALAFFGTRAADHWIYPMTLTLIPLAALGMYYFSEKISKRVKKKYRKKLLFPYSIYALFLLYPAYFILMIVFQPLASPLPQSAKFQYYGCRMDMFLNDKDFLNRIARHEKIIIGTENDKGFKNFIAVSLWDNKNITVNGYWSKNNEIPRELEIASEKMQVFYARLSGLNDNFSSTPPSNVPVEIVSNLISGTGPCTYRLFKVN